MVEFVNITYDDKFIYADGTDYSCHVSRSVKVPIDGGHNCVVEGGVKGSGMIPFASWYLLDRLKDGTLGETANIHWG